jgi:peptide/nickel transport system permease protein
MYEFLWTDSLFYLLLLAAAAFAAYASRKKHLRDPWSRVFRSPMGMATAVILSAFVFVALLDSVHYRPAIPTPPGHAQRYAGEPISLLDDLLTPLRVHHEKTYSAPLAVHSYVKQNVKGEHSHEHFIHPRLQYAGTTLGSPPRGRWADIAGLALTGVGEGLLAAGLVGALLAAALARRRRIRLPAMAGRLRRGEIAVAWRSFCLSLLGLAVVVAVIANLARHYHVFGTDKVGQDVLFEAVKSIRTGVIIGTLTTLVMLPLAMILGIMAGYLRGWVDDAVQYVYTTLNSIPGVLLIAAGILMLQVYMDNHAELFTSTAQRADLRLLFLCLILGVTSWTNLCRLLRGETLKLREMDYVEAATGLGVGRFRIMMRHFVPNVMHIVLIQVVLDFSGLVLAEAVLTYIGVGVDPTMNSWGNMINSARLELAREPMVWWPLLAAFVFMFTLVLAANLFSDVVRDAFDPRLRAGAAAVL